MGFRLTAKDYANLRGVHPDLVRVVEEAARMSTIPFRVNEGLRSVEQQRKNVAKGVSWTLNSRHLTGHAVDLVPMEDTDKDGKVESSEQWAWPVYYRLAPIIKAAAKKAGVPVEWGGDWASKNKDGPHWQLPKNYKPARPSTVSKEVAKIVATEPLMEPKTETQAAVKDTVITATPGAIGVGGALDADTIDNVSMVVTGQQEALTSGSTIRLVIAAVIIGLTLYGIYRIWKAKQ